MQKPILTLGGVLWRSHGGMSLPVMAGLILVLGLARPGQAAEFACAPRDVPCLINAIHAANINGEADTITLAAGTYILTVVDHDTDGPNGLPSITGSLTIQGAGVQSTILERAPDAPHFRLLHIAPTGALTLEGLNLRGGSIDNGQVVTWGGGGIFNNGGRVILSHSLLSSNRLLGGVSSGGGLFNYTGHVVVNSSTLAGNSIDGAPQANGGGLATAGGTVTITNSTIAGNQSIGTFVSGGGVAEIASGGALVKMEIVNSSIAGNIVKGHSVSGSGLKTAGGTVTITNSTIAGNQSIGFNPVASGIAAAGPVTLQNTIVALHVSNNRAGPDCVGPVISLDYNLIGDPTGCPLTLQPHDLTGNPGLGANTDDGMPGHGHLPLAPTSQAIDAGNDPVCPATDQLGQLRVTPCDIGAIEFSPVTLTLGLNHASFCAGDTLRVRLGVYNPGPTVTADAYLGVLLPDGVTVLFVTSLAPLNGVVTRLDADPRTFAPLAASYEFTLGLDVTLEDFFIYTFTGGESAGAYAIFTLLTPPGAFADGQVDAGDLLGLTLQPFTVRP